MSKKPYSPIHGSSGHQAFTHIFRATRHAYEGRHEEAEAHVKKAHHHVAEHYRELTMSERHSDANEFSNRAQYYLKQLDKLMPKKKLGKSTTQTHVAIPSGNITTPAQSPKSPASVPMNMAPGKPRGEYKWKAFHEMSPENQQSALHKYGEREMHQYLYAHNDEGELQHTTRWKAPEHEMNARKPKADQHFPSAPAVQPQIPPQHKAGAGVRINSEGSEMHGKIGLVQGPNPSMPGKIVVRVMHGGMFQNVFVEPHEVKLSKLAQQTQGQTSSVKKSELVEAVKSAIKRAKDLIGLKKEG